MVTELEQLALDPLISRASILPGYALDQRDHSVFDGWTPEAVGIGPFLGDQPPVPAQNRARCDQAMSAQHLRQSPHECGEYRAIRPVQAWRRVSSASTATS